MTFKEFYATNPQSGYYTETDCHALEWESTNGKWCKPEPLEWRQECGYLNDLWNGRIEDVRPLITARERALATAIQFVLDNVDFWGCNFNVSGHELLERLQTALEGGAK